ncbi:MAG: glycerophosphodiester phosphodiesterase family protein [Betaproteobacteria bacterium]
MASRRAGVREMGGIVLLNRRLVLKWGASLLALVVLAWLGTVFWQPRGSLPPGPLPWEGWAVRRPFAIADAGALSAPAYTLPAFRQAVVAGAQALVLPLRFTADGEPVVFPPGDLSSSTDGHGDVESFPLADLQQLDAGYRFADLRGAFPFRGHGLQIPLLEEVLAAFPGVPLLIEVVAPSPDPEHLERLARIVKRWEVSGTILLAARSPEVAGALRQLCPAAPAVSTPAETALFRSLARLGLTAAARPVYHLLRIAPPEVTPRLVEAAHDRRLAVLAGPVCSPGEAKRLAELGVDGLILAGKALVPPAQ